ncbi:Lysozyme [uncultured Alphaproteobacteria bacterium]|uniref:Lysozyme n=1 Tax=uncultured Alphaproteobacteria bacterium TaxID=91750 RepID=A0A212KJZ8_9PROT|nr:Lysozyme [uncultured Alphaproteobacteria bacterium]
MPRLSKSVLALIAAGASALTIATQFISEEEGLSLQAYQDGARVWTICYGHTGDVQPDDVMTPEQCEAWLKTDVGIAFATVDKVVKVPLRETTRAAITSWFFNLGGGRAARQSTLIAKLNGGDIEGACNEIPRWHYAGGKDCLVRANQCYGVVERRERERLLCLL